MFVLLITPSGDMVRKGYTKIAIRRGIAKIMIALMLLLPSRMSFLIIPVRGPVGLNSMLSEGFSSTGAPPKEISWRARPLQRNEYNAIRE